MQCRVTVDHMTHSVESFPKAMSRAWGAIAAGAKFVAVIEVGAESKGAIFSTSHGDFDMASICDPRDYDRHLDGSPVYGGRYWDREAEMSLMDSDELAHRGWI